jgi:arylsulfatase
LLVTVAVFIGAASVGAQQISGPPCSPAATQSLNSKSLPATPGAFKGVINMTASESTPCWDPQVVPPKGAPNILLILTDDEGYGVSSTFGGVIPTPALDRVANMGLRYTQFHTTALCSPTRAALITGRNHHSVGFGVISEISTGFPGYNSIFGPEDSTIGEILRDNGYATSWFGKDHNTPSYQTTVAGPYNQWPMGMGFDYFYGFVGGETDQWNPMLYQNTTQIYPWVGKPGYNLTTDMADEAIKYLKELNASAPDKPFFLYYAPGGAHSPHQPTPEWIDKFQGKFDMGWNQLREQIIANQKRIGVIPPGTQLTPWPDGQPEYGGTRLDKWDTLSADEKKLFARQAEVYAAYVAYTDHEIGRVIQEVDDLGKLNDTLIIYICGDNGTSPEGSTVGTPNQYTTYNGILDVPIAVQMKAYKDWGDQYTYPHMAVAWAWAFDTPFKWTKQVASHFGGTRNGMAISWPGHITDAGGIRTQFHHVIDIAPTILEATGIPAPDYVDGIAQKPIEGVSMAYTFNKANASASSKRETQYFEMLGNRAIYHDGWLAATTPPAAPWLLGNTKLPDDVVNGYKWELYNIADDYSEYNDLSAKMPDKLRDLQELFLVEAQKYQVFPLDNSTLTRVILPRPSVAAGRNLFTYSGVTPGIPAFSSPSILNTSYTITADVEVPQSGAEGVLVTEGGRFGGYALYLLKGKPVFNYNFVGLEHFRWEGADALAPGKHTIVFDFKYDGGGFGKGGTGTLSVDGKEVASKSVPHTTPFLITMDETFDVGLDTRTPVDDHDYQVPFAFNGTIDKLTINLKPILLSADEQKQFDEMQEQAYLASE